MDRRTSHVCFKVGRHHRCGVFALMQSVRPSKNCIEEEAWHWGNLQATRSILIQPWRAAEASPFPTKVGRRSLRGEPLRPETWESLRSYRGGGDEERNQYETCHQVFFLAHVRSLAIAAAANAKAIARLREGGVSFRERGVPYREAKFF